MNRAQAVAIIAGALEKSDRVIVANGAMGREFFCNVDNPRHFYLVGSMGLAASVGVGFALQRPDTGVVVLDGDGNLIMGMGGLLLAGGAKPGNFLHLVIDNGEYATTGRQPTGSGAVDLEAVAGACGYEYTGCIRDREVLKRELARWKKRRGPVFLRVMVSPGAPLDVPRLPYGPEEMSARFIDSE